MALVLIKHGVHHPIAKAKIECAAQGDSLVLIQDGVFWAIADELEGVEADVYALQEDLCARGYQVEDNGASLVSYSDLVDLIVKEEKTIT